MVARFPLANLSTQGAGRSRRAGTGPALLIAPGTHIPLPQLYNMAILLIPTAAVVALSASTTDVSFGGGDGWVVSQDRKRPCVACPLCLTLVAARMRSDARGA